MAQKSNTHCHFFKKGNCKKGKDCNYLHEIDQESPGHFPGRSSPLSRNNVPNNRIENDSDSESQSSQLKHNPFPFQQNFTVRMNVASREMQQARYQRPAAPILRPPNPTELRRFPRPSYPFTNFADSSQAAGRFPGRSSPLSRNNVPNNRIESDSDSDSYTDLSDTLSNLSHSMSSISSTVSEVDINCKDEGDFLLRCNTSEHIKPNYRLKEYVLEQRSLVTKLFLSEKCNLNNKRYEAFKVKCKLFEKRNEALKGEEKLLIRYEDEFNRQMHRLDKFLLNPTHQKHFIKNAFDREFKRAQMKLPIYGYRDEIIQKLKENNVIIIVGFTGSGKTTQAGQYLLEAGFGHFRKIICTEPRKVACISLSKRVSEEMNIAEDTLITYRVGTEKKKLSEEENKKRNDALKNSKLVFTTDKCLLNLYKRDKNLKSYSCVIVDEAHERNLFTDILLCELKKLVAKRSTTKNPLKLIIMSATIDHEKMSKYFDNCPVVNVPGQMYPVEIFYDKMQTNYVDQAVDKLKYVIRGSERHPGDILVFLTMYDELLQALKKCEIFLKELGKKNDYICLLLYGKMDADEQAKVFATYDWKTKIIFATNVAETSLTIDGVRTIIDSGRVKERVYDQIRNISLLKVNLISQSSATQRKGRAGRTASGKCYRLYEESDFFRMQPILQPEIFKIHLGLVILQLLSCGVENPLAYDLIDKPDGELMLKTLNNLVSLKLVGSDVKLTEKGKLAAEMYLEPSISRMVLEGLDLDVAYETAIIAAMLSVSHILFNQAISQEDKSLSLLKMSKPEGDLISMMELFKEYKKQSSFKQKKDWCAQNHFSPSTFRQAEQCFTEIWSVIKRSPLLKNKKNKEKNQKNVYELLLNAICAGLHLNLAYCNGTSNEKKVYKLVELNQEAFIHPGSVLHLLHENAFDDKFLLFSEIFRGDKLYMKNVTPVSVDILQKFTGKDLHQLRQCVKENFKFRVNKTILQNLRSKAEEYIEILEEQLGYAFQVNEDTIEIEIAQADKPKVTEILIEHFEKIKNRLANELYELNSPDLGVKIIVKSSLVLHTLLFNEEYLRLNLYNILANQSEQQIERDIKRIAGRNSIIDFRIYRSTTSNSSGYVVLDSYENALRTYQHFSALLNKSFNLMPSASLESKVEIPRAPILEVEWFLSEPEGSASLTFKTPEEQHYALACLKNEGFRVQVDNNDPDLKLFVENATKDNVFIDEYQFKKYVSKFARVDECFFFRKPVLEPQDINSFILNIRQLFWRFGEYEATLAPFEENKKGEIESRFKAYVSYVENSSIKRAIESLNGKRGIIGTGNIYMRVNLEHEYPDMPKRVIDTLQKDIERLRKVLDLVLECILSTKEIGNFISISIKSNDNEKLQKSIKLCDVLLKPEIITLAHHKFDQLKKSLNRTVNKRTYKADIQSRYNVCIDYNTKINQFKVYGEKKKEVTAILNQNLNDSNKSSVEIRLKSLKAIMGPSGETYKKLKDEFRGEIMINFKNKTITFDSRESQSEAFEKRIKQLEDEFLKDNKSIVNESKEICSICFCPPDKPLRLILCDHVYCTSCLECQFDAIDMNTKFECIAEGCDKKITICEIKKIVGYNLNKINEKVVMLLNNYMLLKSLTHCGNCNHICKLIGERYNCENCKKEFCAKCHKDHAGRFCEAENEKLFQEYLKNITKKCPNCSVNIEKSGGCNHMTCHSCQQHFCWICLGIFDRNDIYTHMNKAHGSYFSN